MKKLVLSALLVFSLFATAFAQQGKVYETRTVKSKILGMDRSYSIYLPPGYEDGDGSYPVLYLLHGHGDNHTGWVQFGQVRYIADKAIAEGKSAPMIIVMPDGDSVHKGYFNLLDGSYNYEDFFFQELIPHIEQTYKVRAERRYRAIAGLSMGGGGTLMYALRHPEMFTVAAPLSAVNAAWTFEQMKKQSDMTNIPDEKWQSIRKEMDERVILENSPKETLDRIKQIRWYISCGDDDFLSDINCALHSLFRKHQVGHEYRVKDGGHSWSYWRMELPEVMGFASKMFTQY